MPQIKKILFPVDFTTATDKILPFVKDMVKVFNAKLYIMHVIRSPEEFAGFEMGPAWYATFEKELKEGAEKSMRRLVSEQLEDLEDVETNIEIGDIADTIIGFVNDNDVDMIIIGTHGRKGLEKVMFGSVAEGVIKDAPCPVLTINPYKIKK